MPPRPRPPSKLVTSPSRPLTMPVTPPVAALVTPTLAETPTLALCASADPANAVASAAAQARVVSFRAFMLVSISVVVAPLVAISHGAEARKRAYEGQLHLRLAILNAVQPRSVLFVVRRNVEARVRAFWQFGDIAMFESGAPSLRLPSVPRVTFQTNTCTAFLRPGESNDCANANTSVQIDRS